MGLHFLTPHGVPRSFAEDFATFQAAMVVELGIWRRSHGMYRHQDFLYHSFSCLFDHNIAAVVHVKAVKLKAQPSKD